MIQRKIPLAVALLLLPAYAAAFETVDSIRFPSTGLYPAYPAEPGAERPVNFFVEGGVLRDNNVARLSSSANAQTTLGSSQRSDVITRLGAGIRGEQRVFGRQSVRFEARGDQYWYDKYSTFNNFAYNLLGEWRWETAGNLSGTLGFTRRRQLIDLAEVQALTNDQIVEQHLYGTAAYQVAANWRVRGGLDHANLRRDTATVSGHTDTGTAGLDYVTPLGNALGVEVRRSTGDFVAPELVGATLVSNEFRETEVAMVGTYTSGPQWRIGGRLGETKRQHVVLSQRDFSGTTGRVTVDWMPGNKTILGFAAYKETRPIIDAAASYQIVRGVQFGPSWAPTVKLVFNARLITERRTYAGDPAVPLLGLPQRDETLRGVRLGAGWEIQRGTEITFGIDHGIRTSNIILRDYNYTALMANLRHNF